MRLDDALKVHFLVGTITEGFCLGMSAAAKTHLRPAAKAEHFAVLIHNLEVSFDSQGTIIVNRDSGRGHSILR